MSRQREKYESEIEGKFVMDMEEEGDWVSLKGDFAKRGFSDRFFFGYGPRTVIVEFKSGFARDGRRGEKLQNYYREQLRQKGHECHRIKGEEDAEELKKRLIRENLEEKKRWERKSRKTRR